jgi:hypothetical protein
VPGRSGRGAALSFDCAVFGDGKVVTRLARKALGLLAVFAAGLALALGGCGDDDDESGDTTTFDTTTDVTTLDATTTGTTNGTTNGTTTDDDGTTNGETETEGETETDDN